MAKRGRPEPSAPTRRGNAGALQLQQPGDPLAIVGVDGPCDVRVELGMEGLGAALRHLALDLGANLAGHRRLELDVRKRRSQVEARSPDHDRAAALLDQRVDLGAGAPGEPPGAELLGDVGYPEEPMLEAPPLLLGGRAGQDLEPAIDLKRVAGDGNRVLAALAKKIGDGNGNGGLADRRRPKDR